MKATIEAIVKMMQTTKTVVQANLAKFNAIPAFSPAFEELNTLLTQIETLEKKAVESTKGVTQNKDNLLGDLCAAAVGVALPVSAYAFKEGKTELLELMNVRLYKLAKAKSVPLASTCQNIHDAATAVKKEAEPYNLTGDKLDKLNDLIASFNAQVPEVRKTMGEINTSKKDIARLADEATALLEGQLDPMVETLQESDPTAVQLWRSARKTMKPPATTTQLKAFVTEGGGQLPVKDVLFVASNGKDHSATTNDKGEALWKPLPFGKYMLKGEAPGFLPFLLKDLKVTKGKVNKVEVVMERAA